MIPVGHALAHVMALFIITQSVRSKFLSIIIDGETLDKLLAVSLRAAVVTQHNAKTAAAHHTFTKQSVYWNIYP